MKATTRTFTLDDQLAFAALAGDFNPLHVDPLAARRLIFGEVVVHGVHAVLWALDVASARNLLADIPVIDLLVGAISDLADRWRAPGAAARVSGRVSHRSRP